MSKSDLLPVILERESERLRQERETFDQRKMHENRWFRLRVTMGYAAVILLAGVFVVSSYILFRSNDYPTQVVIAAGSALFLDLLGLLAAVWRIVLNPGSVTRLEPATQALESYDGILSQDEQN